MSITKIHLFEKNTDAVPSIRGFEYQKLKTLESWLQNGVDQNNELIYCEYEEDIFHRNGNSQKAKFRQIKLYSSNFSFSSEEINKAITHFFTLYTKAEYLFEDVEFLFEANSKVAQRRMDNDADLLREWSQNQDNLSVDLLRKCADKIKDIIEAHYNSEFKKYEQAGNIPEEVSSGMEFFKQLQITDWENFAKCIRWKFDDLSVDQAIENTTNSINSLIKSLPHKTIDDEQVPSIMSMLFYEVTCHSIEDKPEDRFLDLGLLDKKILESGTKNEKWYSEVYSTWEKVEKIENYFIGEFYEIYNAAQHCKKNKYLWKHSDLWMNLLKLYFSNPDFPKVFRRKALYQLTWLMLKPDGNTYKAAGSLDQLKEDLQEYFSEIGSFDNEELDEAVNLKNLIVGAWSQGLLSFDQETIDQIIKNVTEKLSNALSLAVEPDQICNLLELKGFNQFTSKKSEQKWQDGILTSFNDIIPLLPKTTRYSASELSGRINKILSMFIGWGMKPDAGIILALEKFSDTIEPFVNEREGKYSSAKRNIEKGEAFLKSREKKGILKALSYFHKAKELYLSDETMEGYILSLMNISKLYSSIGLNFAAKYYALSALWMSSCEGDPRLISRIPQSFALLAHIDYVQGCWFSALADFDLYLRAKIELDNDFDIEEVAFRTVSMEMAMIMHTAGISSPQFSIHFGTIQKSWGYVWTDTIKVFKDGISEITGKSDYIEVIKRDLVDQPFNDIGKVRIVQWEALGSTWKISFKNEPLETAIGEEYCALLQVLLGEVALSNSDFHLLKSTININISIGDKHTAPAQIAKKKEFQFNVIIPELKSKEMADLNLHGQQVVAGLGVILGEISLLKQDEFMREYQLLFSQQELHKKNYTINTYQRIYKEFYGSELFEKDQRTNYLPIEPISGLQRENIFLKWNDGLSSNYNKEESEKNISARYKVAHRVMHLTIDALKHDGIFKKFIYDLRATGWLDWQITLAMTNFIVDYKSKLTIKGEIDLNTEEGHKLFNEAFRKTMDEDEEVFKVKFPSEAFTPESFQIPMNRVPYYCLRSWGLECRSSIPMLEAIREFLNKRFRFDIDNVDDGNPLKDVS